MTNDSKSEEAFDPYSEDFQNFLDSFADLREEILCPVSEALFKEHCWQINQDIKAYGKSLSGDALKKADAWKARNEMDQHPAIPIDHAIEAFGSLSMGGGDRAIKKGWPDVIKDPRYGGLTDAFLTIAEAVWQGHDTQPAEQALRELLFDPSKKLNLTINEMLAQATTQAVVESAHRAKRQIEMEHHDTLAYRRFMGRVTQPIDGWTELTQEDLKPFFFVPQFDDFLEAFEKRMESKRFPVTNALYAAHVACTEHTYRDANTDILRTQKDELKLMQLMGEHPSLTYSYAATAFQWRLQNNGPSIGDHSPARVKRMDDIIFSMQQRAASGENITKYEHALAQAFYDPKETINLALGKESAKALAHHLAESARGAAREVYGNHKQPNNLPTR